MKTTAKGVEFVWDLALSSASAALPKRLDVLLVCSPKGCQPLGRLIEQTFGDSRVREAHSVREGCSEARRQAPDVLLVEESLPDGGAHDLLLRLMVARGTVSCPVVVLSEGRREQHPAGLLRLGAGDYLVRGELADGGDRAAAMLERAVIHAREQHRLSRRAALYRANTLIKRRRERAALEQSRSARDDAEAQKREAERARERLDLAVEGAELGTWDWYPATGRIIHNDRLLSMLGYGPDDLHFTYTIWRSLLHPEDVGRTLEALGNHLEGRTSQYRLEYRLRTKQGGWKWVLVSGRVVSRDDRGRPTRVTGVHLDIDDRKRAELGLVEAKNYAESAQQQLIDLVTSIRDAFLLIDSQWRFTFVNPRAEELLGHSAADTVGKVIWQVLPGLEDSPFGPALHRAMQERRMAEASGLYEPANKWFDARIYPAEEGSVSLFLLDVTESRRAEEAIRASEQRNRLLVDAARQLGSSLEPEAIYTRLRQIVSSSLPCTGMVVSSYDEAEGLIRCAYAWIAGNIVDASTLPPLTFKPESQGMQTQVIRTGRPMIFSDVTRRVRDPKGTYYEVNKSGKMRNLRDGDPPTTQSALMVPVMSEGKVTGVVQVMTDVEDAYTLADQELLEGVTLQLGVALENARLYRRAQQQIDERRRAEEALREEQRLVQEAKESAEAARSAAERAREGAERANRAKSEFLAVLSHELRTPLTPVLAGVQLLNRELSQREPSRVDIEEVRDTLAMVQRNVELEVRLIDDLLDLTRITRGKLQLSRQRIDLNASVRHVLEICRADLREKRLELALDLPDDPVGLVGDPARLQQVLWNLVKNAIKFTSSGGNIAVRTRIDPDPGQHAGTEGMAVCEVEDSGVGIDPAVLPGVFNAFEQGGESVTRTFGGLGLGLAISRAIVVAHGGSISARSRGRGQGSTFTIRLPAISLGSQPAQRSAPPLPPARTGSRVLLVEDHRDTARLMARFLEKRLGVQVLCAYTMEEGVRLFVNAADRGIDLIISDIGLPDGTGTELLRSIHAMHGGQAREPATRHGAVPPALALSGYGTEQDIQSSREAGFREHITKPVDLERLEQAVRQMLG